MDNNHATELAENPATGQSDGLIEIQDPANPASGTAEGSDEQNGQDSQDPKVQLAIIQERYKASSQEGVRLAKELKEIKAQLVGRETQQAQQQQSSFSEFPPEDAGVKFYTEKLGLDEADARHRYRQDKAQFETTRRVETALQAQANQMRYLQSQVDKAQTSSNPDAAQAEVFFKSIPHMDMLPAAEKLSHYQALKQQGLIVTPRGQDKSNLRMAAAGNAGSANGRSGAPAPGATQENERIAKAAGFNSWQAMQEMRRVSNAEEYADWQRKYVKKT